MHPAIAVPATLAIVYRAYSRRSLTPIGLLAATVTAIIHALHPSSVPFTLLGVFFLIGTAATKVKHDVKATLTLASDGGGGGEGSRTHVQVIANSGTATILVILHLRKYGLAGGPSYFTGTTVADVVLVGIISNYAAVAADTLSSELGILSKGEPVLITTLKKVPKGTNGGVSLAGLLAGAGGSAVIALTSVLLLQFGKDWSFSDKMLLGLGITALGTAGSLLDSLLGAVLQASVVDKRGKVIEGHGGSRVLVSPKQTDAIQGGSSRRINSGRDILDNNEVNLLMANVMSLVGITIASVIWQIPLWHWSQQA